MTIPLRILYYTTGWFFSSLKPPKDLNLGVGREVQIPEGKQEISTGTQALGKEVTRQVPSISEAVSRVPGMDQLKDKVMQKGSGMEKSTSASESVKTRGTQEVKKTKKKTTIKKEEQTTFEVVPDEVVERKREALHKNEHEVISKITTMAKAAEDILNTVKSEEKRLKDVLQENDRLNKEVFQFKSKISESENLVKNAQNLLSKEQERVSKLESSLKEELERERQSTSLLNKILTGQREEISALEAHIQDLHASSERLEKLRVHIAEQTTVKEEEIVHKQIVRERETAKSKDVKTRPTTGIEMGKMIEEGSPAPAVQESVQKKSEKKTEKKSSRMEEFKAEETKKAVVDTQSNIPTPPPLPDIRKLLGETTESETEESISKKKKKKNKKKKAVSEEAQSTIPTPPPLPDMKKLLGETKETKEKRVEFKGAEVLGETETQSNIPTPPPLPDMKKLLGETKETKEESKEHFAWRREDLHFEESNIPAPPPLPDMNLLLQGMRYVGGDVTPIEVMTETKAAGNKKNKHKKNAAKEKEMGQGIFGLYFKQLRPPLNL